ncbi:hypothetical protein T4B_10414 [Trichinella pseudospiralis]|uniref:Uncharacterized protein n=1 Tax=Trichinella pseudospiralis TaxID=6337 RepID=A0A0V1ILU9_TRIPS|nr:hypothetical protein T4B_10414 [Trichinella pseudospiralis]
MYTLIFMLEINFLFQLSKFCKEDDISEMLAPFFRALSTDNSLQLPSSNYHHESLPQIKNFRNIKNWMDEVEKYFKSEKIPSEVQRALLWNLLPVDIKDLLVVFDIDSDTEIKKIMAFLKQNFRINGNGELQLLLCDIVQGEKESICAFSNRIKTFMKFNFPRTNKKVKDSFSALQFLNGMSDKRLQAVMEEHWQACSFMTLVRVTDRLSKSEMYKNFNKRTSSNATEVDGKGSKKNNANVMQLKSKGDDK